MTVRRVLTIVFFVFGFFLWWAETGAASGLPIQLFTGGVAVTLCLFPTTRRLIVRKMELLRLASTRSRWRATLIVGLASAAYFVLAAWSQGRDFKPKWSDEFSLLLQTHIYAAGHLSMPAHPLADSLDTFYTLVRPVYASIYFCGTPLLYTPQLLLGLPTWLLPLMITSLGVAIMYLVIDELLDGAFAAVAVLLMWATGTLRLLSIMVMSQQIAMTFGIALVWAYLQWRKRFDWRWAVVLGLLAGWLTITRPADTAYLTIAIIVAGVFDLRRERFATLIRTAIVVALTAAPILAIQLVVNHNASGSWRTSPYQMYLQQYDPEIVLGFQDADPHRVMPTPAKQAYFDEGVVPAVRFHARAPIWVQCLDRLPRFVTMTTGWPVFVVLCPLSLLALNHKRAVLWIVLLLFFAFYLLYAYFTAQYLAMAIPAWVLWQLMGIEAIALAFPNSTSLRPAMLFCVAMIVLPYLPPMQGGVHDEIIDGAELNRVDEALQSVQKPAVVMFRFVRGQCDVQQEPVFNSGVAWPDDADVVRLHDLGEEKNLRVLQYYGSRKPDRTFYLYDRATGALSREGLGSELLRLSGPAPTAR
ncbi:hypothetical protein BH10PLA1_BH10PLA1_08650 [soil metagenome]